MKRKASTRRRPSVHITMVRAARLHRMVVFLEEGARSRELLLAELNVGLRTFYRELELLKRCGIKIRLDGKNYALKTTTSEAEERLPFPDPQLSFAEMAELSRGTGDAATRMAALYAQVVAAPNAKPKGRGRRKSASP